jgi:hypothetical protein
MIFLVVIPRLSFFREQGGVSLLGGLQLWIPSVHRPLLGAVSQPIYLFIFRGASLSYGQC